MGERATAVWTVISRIRAGAAAGADQAGNKRPLFCPRKWRGREVTGQGPPGAGEGTASGRMGPLCTWRGWLWGPDLGAQEESREEEDQVQRQRREARGCEMPQRVEIWTV